MLLRGSLSGFNIFSGKYGLVRKSKRAVFQPPSTQVINPRNEIKSQTFDKN
jgi:hypothetical protein